MNHDEEQWISGWSSSSPSYRSGLSSLCRGPSWGIACTPGLHGVPTGRGGLYWRCLPSRYASSFHPTLALYLLLSRQVIFSVYHFCLSHYISGPAPTSPATLQELQSAYARVFRAGLGYPAGASKKGYGAHESNFDQDLFTLDPMDPRAVDFRNFLRTW